VSEHNAEAIKQVVGIRLDSGGPLTWCLAGDVPAEAGRWVVVKLAEERLGLVVVGRGQCRAFPVEFELLPVLSRLADANELQAPAGTAGTALLAELSLDESDVR
jgi:hypothetical protein